MSKTPLYAAIVAILINGCSDAPKSQVDVSTPLNEAKVIEIARKAVAENDTWVERATFEAVPSDDGWSVTVWREPRTPGGHRAVSIDQNGNVTRYMRGK